MKKLWLSALIVVVASFGVLGWIGTRIYQQMPPIPDRVVSSDGVELIASGEIGRGQNVWQAMGGMEVGSIWGHGSYVAPDWTADWLHREAVFVLDEWARALRNASYDKLTAEEQGELQARLQQMYRTNTYDPATGVIRIDPVRARAFEACLAHYSDVFMNGETDYAIPAGTVGDPAQMKQLAAFIFWTAWAAVDQPAGREHLLHQQLAPRAAGRQSPNRGNGHVDRREHHHAAGRDLAPWWLVRLAEAAGRSGACCPKPIR